MWQEGLIILETCKHGKHKPWKMNTKVNMFMSSVILTKVATTYSNCKNNNTLTSIILIHADIWLWQHTHTDTQKQPLHALFPKAHPHNGLRSTQLDICSIKHTSGLIKPARESRLFTFKRKPQSPLLSRTL